MDASFVRHLTAQSVLADLPAYDVTLDLEVRGGVLGEIFERQPRLPGVVVKDGEAVRGAISKGQYLRLVGRYLGQEVYHPRPLRLMLEAIATVDKPLVLADRTPIQEAVQRALGRPRELVYEPVIVETGASGPTVLRLVDFQDLLLADSRISALRNEQMRQILSTVQEGFLLVGPDRKIAAEHSRSIQTIFGTVDVAGRTFEDFLADCLDAELADLGKGYLETLFNPNVIEHLVADINPLSRVEARIYPRGAASTALVRKHLAFRFRRSVDGRRIDRVLVRVEDVTRSVELERELAAQQEKAREKVDLVFDIVRSGVEPLDRFLTALEDAAAGAQELLGERGGAFPGRAAVEPVLRRMHGLKGEAGLLGLELFQGRIHQLEDRLVGVRDRTGDLRLLVSLAAALGELRTLMGDTRELLNELRSLGRGPAHDQTRPEAAAPTATAPAATAPPARPPAGGNGRPAADSDLFVGMAQLVQDLSRRLEKPARFISHNPESEIPALFRPLVRQALPQWVRNSLVHGLEPGSARTEAGKPALGTLQFAIRQHPKQARLELIFQDDGGGLDLERLRRRAAERGLAAASEAELTQLIFQSGFSTAEQTTLDAGRGVGLDLIRDAVEGHGGVIRCHSRPGVFCAFQVLLPWSGEHEEA